MYFTHTETSSDAHPASCPVRTSGSFPKVKRGQGVTLTTHPHLVPRSRMNTSYISTLPWRLHGDRGQLDFYLQIQDPFVSFRNLPEFALRVFFTPFPTIKLEDHPLSTGQDCLFNTCVWRQSPRSATRGRAVPLAQGTQHGDLRISSFLLFSLSKPSEW
jgi:hypothetical protein